MAAALDLECERARGARGDFAHALYNFGEVLNEEEMIERTKLVLASPYIRSRENIWDVFTRKYSGVLAKINAMNKEFTNGCIT